MSPQGPGGLAGLRGPTGAGSGDRVRPEGTHASSSWPTRIPVAHQVILAGTAVGLIGLATLMILGVIAAGAALFLLSI